MLVALAAGTVVGYRPQIATDPGVEASPVPGVELVDVDALVADGDQVHAGAAIARLSGPAASRISPS